MRDIKDQDGGIFSSGADIRGCDHILRERDRGEVFDILVESVDYGAEFLRLGVFGGVVGGVVGGELVVFLIDPPKEP